VYFDGIKAIIFLEPFWWKKRKLLKIIDKILSKKTVRKKKYLHSKNISNIFRKFSSGCFDALKYRFFTIFSLISSKFFVTNCQITNFSLKYISKKGFELNYFRSIIFWNVFVIQRAVQNLTKLRHKVLFYGKTLGVVFGWETATYSNWVKTLIWWLTFSIIILRLCLWLRGFFRFLFFSVQPEILRAVPIKKLRFFGSPANRVPKPEYIYGPNFMEPN